MPWAMLACEGLAREPTPQQALGLSLNLVRFSVWTVWCMGHLKLSLSAFVEKRSEAKIDRGVRWCELKINGDVSLSGAEWPSVGYLVPRSS